MKEQTYTLFMEALEYAEQVGERSTEPIRRCRPDASLVGRVERFPQGSVRRSENRIHPGRHKPNF
jgi:hypothetical protein